MNGNKYAKLKEENSFKIKCDTIFDFGEKMPKFKGGDTELLKYNMDRITPILAESKKEDGILISKLLYSVVISKDGEILDAEIISEIDNKIKAKLETEILKMPNWVAGEVNGQVECMKIKIPISCIKWE